MEADKSVLRKFGIAFGIALAIIGTIQLAKGRLAIYPWFYLIGLFSIICGIFHPAAIKPLYFILTKIGRLVGEIITSLMLLLVFYLILYPVSLIAKLLGKRFLDISWNEKSTTYWIVKEQPKGEAERYEKQY